MAAGCLRYLGACQHAGDLFDAALAVKSLDFDLCAVFDYLLAHEQVRVGEPRDLRLMRDAEDLIRLRQLFELRAYGFRYAAAYPRVDFVKDYRARKLRSVGDSL